MYPICNCINGEMISHWNIIPKKSSANPKANAITRKKKYNNTLSYLTFRSDISSDLDKNSNWMAAHLSELLSKWTLLLVSMPFEKTHSQFLLVCYVLFFYLSLFPNFVALMQANIESGNVSDYIIILFN